MVDLPLIICYCLFIGILLMTIEIFVYKKFIDKELEYESENKENTQ